MYQIPRKPLHASWQTSIIPLPMPTGSGYTQNAHAHAHHNHSHHQAHAADHRSCHDGMCQGRTLTTHYAPHVHCSCRCPCHDSDDSGDSLNGDDDLEMAAVRPYSPLGDNTGLGSMHATAPNGNWIPAHRYQASPSPVSARSIPSPMPTFGRVSPGISHEGSRIIPGDIPPVSPAMPSPTLTVPPPQPPQPPQSPPNGGTAAWLQVVGAFLLFFNSWGLVNTFGVFQEYFQETYLSSFAPSAISWIGTVQGFLLIVVGVLSGPLYDLGYLRGLIGVGTALIFLGLLMAGEVQQYFGIFISLSLLVGLGAGCLFVPSVAIVAQYFTTKRPFATGIAAAGGSFGGVIFPIVFKAAIDSVGYSWACRILALIVLVTLVCPFFIMKARSIPGTKRKLLDPGAFRDPAYSLFSLSLFVTFVGLYIPFFYLPSYAKAQLGVDVSLAFYMLAIMNSGSFFGRLIPNLVANYAGSMNILLLCVFTAGILVFFWIPVQDLAGVIAFAILYGFFSGAVVSLPPTALVAISPDLSKIGARLGMSFSFAGFGLLVGNPIAGALLQSRYHYKALQVFSGTSVMLGFVLLGCAALVHSTRKARLEKGEK